MEDRSGLKISAVGDGSVIPGLISILFEQGAGEGLHLAVLKSLWIMASDTDIGSLPEIVSQLKKQLPYHNKAVSYVIENMLKALGQDNLFKANHRIGKIENSSTITLFEQAI